MATMTYYVALAFTRSEDGEVVACEPKEARSSDCQSASKIDPRSASKIDPLGDEELPVALAPAELVGVVEPGRARWV